MFYSGNSVLVFVFLVFGLFVSQGLASEGLSCNSCGDECTQSCGTRHFRTCCFNYLRKRSDPSIRLHPEPEPHMTNDLADSVSTLNSGSLNSADIQSFNEGQTAKSLAFVNQLQRFIFGQITAFFYVQLTESRRFYNLMLDDDRNNVLQTTAPLIGA